MRIQAAWIVRRMFFFAVLLQAVATTNASPQQTFGSDSSLAAHSLHDAQIASQRIGSPGNSDAAHSELALLRLQVQQVQHAAKKHNTEPLTPAEYYGILAGVVVLVVLGGIVAGLTIGLMSLDETNLSILQASGTPSEKAFAARIAPIRRNTHLLLVTLLLANTVVNETLPIMLDAIHFEGWQAVLCSTLLIVIFGEIIPQAVCTRYGLQIGAFFAWPVRILIFCLWIVAYPVARLLDAALGHKHGVIYRRAELRELVALHGEDQAGPLTRDEVSVLRAVLDLRDKTVANIMTRIDDVFMLPLSTSLDMPTLQSIMQAGHSRIPVHDDADREKVIGVVLVKQLIVYDPEDAVPLSSIKIRRLPRVMANTPLFEMLHIFEEGGSHMALVYEEIPESDEDQNETDQHQITPKTAEHLSASSTDPTTPPARLFGPHITTKMSNAPSRSVFSSQDDEVASNQSQPLTKSPSHASQRHLHFRTLGIVTLEDVLEELLGEEIIDETDVYIDMATKVKVAHAMREHPELRHHLLASPQFGSVVHHSRSSSNLATPNLAFANPISAAPNSAIPGLSVPRRNYSEEMSVAEDERIPLLANHHNNSSGSLHKKSPHVAPKQTDRLIAMLKNDMRSVSSLDLEPAIIQLPDSATALSQQSASTTPLERVLDLSSLAPVPSQKYIKSRRRREREELPAGDLATRLETSPERVYLPSRGFSSRTSVIMEEDTQSCVTPGTADESVYTGAALSPPKITLSNIARTRSNPSTSTNSQHTSDRGLRPVILFTHPSASDVSEAPDTPSSTNAFQNANQDADRSAVVQIEKITSNDDSLNAPTSKT